MYPIQCLLFLSVPPDSLPPPYLVRIQDSKFSRNFGLHSLIWYRANDGHVLLQLFTARFSRNLVSKRQNVKFCVTHDQSNHSSIMVRQHNHSTTHVHKAEYKEWWAVLINNCPWSFPITNGVRASLQPFLFRVNQPLSAELWLCKVPWVIRYQL